MSGEGENPVLAFLSNRPHQFYRRVAVIALLATLSIFFPDRRLQAKALIGAFSPVWSPDSQKIAYTVQHQDHLALYMIDLDRGLPVLLAEQGEQTAWSPDGSRIAYASYAGDTPRIAIVNVDSKVSTPLTMGYSPKWSPDGKQIAYLVAGVLHMADANGGTPRRRISDQQGSIRDFDWSSDGEHIAYSAQGTSDNATALYIMNPDGSEVHKIADGSYDMSMAWSPDSQQLAFVGFCNPQRAEYLCTIHKDGSDPHALLPYLGIQPVDPTWSPDGQQILYSYGGRICLSAADGAYLRYLTELRVYSNDIQASWSPDGSRILFVRMDQPGVVGREQYILHSDIYVMNADGSHVYNLTNTLDTF